MKMNAALYARLIKYLLLGEHDMVDLARLTKLHYTTVQRYCRELHRAKAIHITELKEDIKGRECIKVYKIGPGKDAVPFKLPRDVENRRYREAKALRAAQAALTFRPTLQPELEIEALTET